MTGSGPIDAERAFTREARARRRAALARRLRREPAACGRLAVLEARGAIPRRGRARRAGDPAGGDPRHARAEPGVAVRRRVPPDGQGARPLGAPVARRAPGRTLPPIAVVPVGDGFAVRDGHHRVSVARARGALTIDALVTTA